MPGNPKIVLGDEAQDWGRKPLEVLRKLTKDADQLILIGDADQTLYEWAGASVEAFLTPLPESRQQVLEQSRRVPKKIHNLAVRWIETIPNREKIVYYPRRESYPSGDFVEGAISRNLGSYRFPEKIVEDAVKKTSQGKSVIIMTACNYMLEPVIKSLRDNYIPYSNPFRTNQGNWNPLADGSESRTTAKDRVLAFLRPTISGFWSWSDVFKFTEYMQANGVLKRGAKTKLDAYKDNFDEIAFDELGNIFEESVLPHLMSFDLDWFRGAMLTSKKDVFNYPIEVVKKYGHEALTADITLWVGTIHSFKGEEADVVYLIPDLSDKFYAQWSGSVEGRNAVKRMYYVAMTRAREELVLCQAISAKAVPLR
jgi:DNA helicase-2/ATP-dependent DNA helicase PcrA